MKKFIFIFLTIISSSNLFAEEVPKAEIIYVGTWTNHIDIKMDTTGLDPHGCGFSDLYRVDLKNDSGAREKLSTLLSAFMAGKKVGLSINGCVKDRPRISGVRLYK